VTTYTHQMAVVS